MAPDAPIPVLTSDLAHRIEQAAVSFSRCWLGGIGGLDLGDFGPHLLVGCHPGRRQLDFQNRVNGLTPADAGRIPEIGAFYDERGVRPWWEIVPDDHFAAIGDALTARGARHIGFHGVVYGRADPATGRATGAGTTGAGVSVRPVEDDATFATYARTRMQAHDLPPEIVEEAAADLGGWFGAPGVTLLLATVDGRPAGTAAFAVHDGIGYLADAATQPAFRRRGIQSLLITARLDLAAAAGCEVVASQATFAGTSHRNLQRHGLVGGFTKVVWR